MLENKTGRRTILATGAAILVLLAGLVLYYFRDLAIPEVGSAINAARSATAPDGTITIETAPGAMVVTDRKAVPAVTDTDWPGFNRTLMSDRFVPEAQINTTNVGQLKVLCTYDTRQRTSFQAGPIVVGGAMIATTEHDIFSIDSATCHENWRIHEDYKSANLLTVNRGAAYLDGRLFRGTQDGRVLAYDMATGKRLWSTVIANPKAGETTPAAPIAWGGLVFTGNAGGDNKGVKGRMYALDAKTGNIVWEFYLVPKSRSDPVRGRQGTTPLDRATWRNTPNTPITGGAVWTSFTLDPATGLLYIPGGNPAPDFAVGPRQGENLYSGSVVVLDARTGAYVNHFKLVPKDWHDWDVSSAPVLFTSRAGKAMMAVAPKDGHIYGFDLATNALRYRKPVTTIMNADASFVVGKPVRFCPGTTGGAEWNGPAYDPGTNLLVVGQVDWCTTVTLQTDEAIAEVEPGSPWSAMDTLNPYHTYGVPDPVNKWGGWVYAVDADSGEWKWRARTNYPVLSGVTPTAGGVVYFGDVGGNFYALDASHGTKLWGRQLDGAIGGGVISYSTKGVQRIAVASGFTSIVWPTKQTTAKIVVLGL